MVLHVGAPLQQEASLLVAQQQRNGAVQQPPLVDFELGGGTDGAVVFVDEDDEIFGGQWTGVQMIGPVLEISV